MSEVFGRSMLCLLLLATSVAAQTDTGAAGEEWQLAPEIVTSEPEPEPAAADAPEQATPPRAPFFQSFNINYRHSFYTPYISGAIERANRISRTYKEEQISFRPVRQWGEFTWTTSAEARSTNDDQVSPLKLHEWELLSLNSSLQRQGKGGDWQIDFGNVYASYDPYAFTASLQGLTGVYRHEVGEGHRLEFSAASGRTHRHLETSQYLQYGNAFAASWQSPAAWWGILDQASLKWTGGSLHDDRATLDDIEGIIPIDARAMALSHESKWRGGFTLTTDWGLATGQQDRSIATPSRKQTGGAFNSNLQWQRPGTWNVGPWLGLILPGSTQSQFELIGQDYFAPQASAGNDVRRWSFQSAHPWAPWAAFNWSLNRSQDNARNRQPVTNYSFTQSYNSTISPFQAPSIAQIFRLSGTDTPMLFRTLEIQNLRLTLGFNHTGRYRTDFTTNVKTEAYSAAAAHQIGPWNFGGRYSWDLIDNDVDVQQDRRSDNWSLNTGRTWNVPSWKLDIQTSGGYQQGRDALRNATQTTWTQGPNASLSFTRGVLTGGGNWSLSRRSQIRNLVPSSSNVHSASANLSYHPSKIVGLSFTLTGDLQQTKEDDDHQNFGTRNLRGDISYEF